MIESIGKTSLVIDGSNATFDVAVGDVLIIGEFKGDNRRVVCRCNRLGRWHQNRDMGSPTV